MCCSVLLLNWSFPYLPVPDLTTDTARGLGAVRRPTRKGSVEPGEEEEEREGLQGSFFPWNKNVKIREAPRKIATETVVMLLSAQLPQRMREVRVMLVLSALEQDGACGWGRVLAGDLHA